MYWMMFNPLRTLPPIGLVAVGALAGVVGVPILKKTARSLAVLTVRSAMSVSDMVKDTGNTMSKEWNEMSREARNAKNKMEATMMQVEEMADSMNNFDDYPVSITSAEGERPENRNRKTPPRVPRAREKDNNI